MRDEKALGKKNGREEVCQKGSDWGRNVRDEMSEPCITGFPIGTG